MSTLELDEMAEAFIRSHEGATPAFKGLYGFPGQRLRIDQPGDRARHPVARSACSRTATSSRSTSAWATRASSPTRPPRCAVGEVDAKSKQLLEVTERALDAGIAAARGGQPHRRHRRGGAGGGGGARASAWCATSWATASARSSTRSRRCRTTASRSALMKLVPGLTIAIEPMVNVGTPKTRTMPDRWTVVTADGSRVGALRAHDRDHGQRAEDPDGVHGQLGRAAPSPRDPGRG